MSRGSRTIFRLKCVFDAVDGILLLILLLMLELLSELLSLVLNSFMLLTKYQVDCEQGSLINPAYFMVASW